MSLLDRFFNKKDPRNTFLSPFAEKDIPLFILAFTSVLGILNIQAKGADFTGFVMSSAFVFFWCGMGFFCGRRRSRSFIITSLCVWGIALLYTLIALAQVAGIRLPDLGALSKAGIYIQIFAYLVAMALFHPLFPVFDTLGYMPEKPLDFVYVWLAFVFLIALSYLVGLLWQKRKNDRPGLKNDPYYTPPELK